MKEFEEEANALAFHPSGKFINEKNIFLVVLTSEFNKIARNY